jgi:phage terminase large subunit-like protein
MSTDRVSDYADRVAGGKVVAGKLHRLACERHLHDLERQRTPEFPYYWDEDAARRVLDFAETLTLSEGFERKPLHLLDCQAFDIGCTFGWKKAANNRRRFRRRYKCVSRQQGKTMENGIMLSYIAAFSGYKEGKIFTVATKKRQANLAWEQAEHFIQADPDLMEYFRIQEYKYKITALNTGCTIESLSRDGGLDDGFRSIASSIDEIHQHKDNGIYKAIYNGTRSLPETLVSMITTRGKYPVGFCHDMDTYCGNILRGMATAEDFFVDIYCMDPDDDIWDESNWAKSCPLTVTVPSLMEILRQDAKTAKDYGGDDLRDFIVKGLNLWVGDTEDVYIKPEHWKACGSERSLRQIVDAGILDCWVGVDLSSGGDLTTISLLFRLPDGKFYVWSHSFIPRGRIVEHVANDLAPYDLWAEQGHITVTGGATDYMTDYKYIIGYLGELKKSLGLRFIGIGIDPANAAGILQDLETFGCPVVTMTQSARNLNQATTEFRLMVKSGKVEYWQKDELLTWSVLNAATTQNSFGEIKIDKRLMKGKKKESKRIDPVDALIDAYALMLILQADAPPVDINDELGNYLDMMGWR